MKALNSPQPVRLHLPEYRRVCVTLVGAGGTGSHVASGLAAISLALAQRGVPLDLLIYDPDTVEERNVGRQLFAAGDVGHRKAEVVAERLRGAFRMRAGGVARAIDERVLISDLSERDMLNLVIGCVDNAPARALIAKAVEAARGRLWWLDCGNENASGQVALGNCAKAEDLRGAIALGMIDRLPSPHLVYPDLVVQPKVPRAPKRTKTHQRGANGASCAVAIEAGEQSLMINRMVAAWACAMLSALLVDQDLRWFAAAFNLVWAGAKAYTIDAEALAQAVGLKASELAARSGRKR